MAKFIVTTTEYVTGTYEVEATDAEAACRHFGDPKIDWTNVEQRDYQAFACDVQSVEPRTTSRPV